MSRNIDLLIFLPLIGRLCLGGGNRRHAGSCELPFVAECSGGDQRKSTLLQSPPPPEVQSLISGGERPTTRYNGLKEVKEAAGSSQHFTPLLHGRPASADGRWGAPGGGACQPEGRF